MQRAVELSAKALTSDRGGPFGAIIVMEDEIVGSGYNQVVSTNDPTAHAEILAIRDACRYLATYDLDQCEIYCSCEPCPMCLGAIYWSRISRIYYSNTRMDAASIGFEDDFFFREIAKLPGHRSIPSIRVVDPSSLTVFRDWEKKIPRINY